MSCPKAKPSFLLYRRRDGGLMYGGVHFDVYKITYGHKYLTVDVNFPNGLTINTKADLELLAKVWSKPIGCHTDYICWVP